MRRIERLVNLVALLANSSRPLSIDEIWTRVPGYDTENPQAARRTFERDKEAVREMGIDLRAVSLDPLSGPGPGNVGYEIPIAERVADPGLTLAERGVLAVASSVVWEQAPRDGRTDAGEQDPTLDTAGIDLDGVRPHPLVEVLLNAIAERRRVTLEYESARAEAPRRRTISPYGMTHRRGRWYLAGHDSLSEEVRAFRLDRILGDLEVGGTAGFSRPEGFRMADVVPARGWEFGDAPPVQVEIAVHPDCLWWVAPQAGREPVSTFADVDGVARPVIEVPVRNLDVFCGWVLSLLDAAVVIGPPEVRTRIRESLRLLCRADP